MTTSPFIYWKQPGEKGIFTIVNPRYKKIKEPEIVKEGFCFFPYKRASEGYLIEGKIEQTTQPSFPKVFEKINKKNTLINSENYVSLVNKAIDKIRDQNFEKVVLARAFAQQLPDNFNLNLFFEKLCDTYKDAFVYCVQLENEIWVGATPEIFLKKENKTYLTYALAGTKNSMFNLKFGEKERGEQQLVKNYIVDILNQQNAEYIEISKTEELNTGNLTHLVNKIKFKTNNPVAIINHLHPTPAVCGVPYVAASYFIDNSENLDREYYSGFLGPVFKNQDFSFWVNLRCAKITGDEIQFYAGAGIVMDSKAEDEWLETERKMDTLLHLL